MLPLLKEKKPNVAECLINGGNAYLRVELIDNEYRDKFRN